MANCDVDPLLGQGLVELAHRVLRLRDRHAVARHDDHLLRVLHDERGVVGRARLEGLVGVVGGAHRCGLAEAAQDHRDERAIHRPAHDVAQDGARAADQGTGDDQHRVLQREADARRRPARVGVQHRDHDRHVGAADRDDQQEADREGQERHQHEGQGVRGGDEPDQQQHDQRADHAVDDVPAGQQDRLGAHRRPDDRHQGCEPTPRPAAGTSPAACRTRSASPRR